MATFKKATKSQAKLRLALTGPSGSGKTYTSIAIATEIGGPIAVIDTERGSAAKYADRFEFDVLELTDFSPAAYIEAIDAAAAAGYRCLVVDSLSHAWSGRGGALELVDEANRRSKSGNTYTAWREVTPLHNALVDAILGFPGHVFATMRSKTEYVVEKGPNGKSSPRKVGLAPIQRDGIEFEFDVVAELTHDNEWITGKTRCSALARRAVSLASPGATAGIAREIVSWLTDGPPAPHAAHDAAAEVAAPPGQVVAKELVAAPVAAAEEESAADRALAYLSRAVTRATGDTATQADVDGIVSPTGAVRLELRRMARGASAQDVARIKRALDEAALLLGVTP
jgi:hypothetical protein